MYLLLHAEPKDSPFAIAEKACFLVALTHIPVEFVHTGVTVRVLTQDDVESVLIRYQNKLRN